MLEPKFLYFYATIILLFRINISEDIIHSVKLIELYICFACRSDSISLLVEIHGNFEAIQTLAHRAVPLFTRAEFGGLPLSGAARYTPRGYVRPPPTTTLEFVCPGG